jgi:hypothetical protein
MASVPNYLKAVTVLEPEGNIAAETAAAVDRLRDRSRSRSVRMFALLGLGTGVLSYLAYEFPLRLLMVSFLLKTTPGPDHAAARCDLRITGGCMHVLVRHARPVSARCGLRVYRSRLDLGV